MTKLLVLDVDGTLNDGTIPYDTQVNELKSFSVKDGLAIVAWLKLGGDIAIITGRESPITDKRACELGITLVFQGVQNKGDVLLQIVQQKNYALDEIAVIGDDVNDIHMFMHSRLNFAPRDCSPLILPYVNHRLKHKGGRGAVREMIEIILHKDGLYDDFMALWL